jgi:GR25 family glycosyltransferase involved in LPS biosynthesis
MNETLFINLQHRMDRLLAVKEQFKQLGVTAKRMEAVRRTPGALGCVLSHIQCIEYALEHDLPRVCICEDDFVVTDSVRFLKQLSLFLTNTPTWDVLLLGSNIAPPYPNITPWSYKVVNAQTTTAYIVQAHYYNTLLSNFKESAFMLMNQMPAQKSAIDIHWKRLQCTGHWFALRPLLVTQAPGYSDIEHRIVNYTTAMLSSKVLNEIED